MWSGTHTVVNGSEHFSYMLFKVGTCDEIEVEAYILSLRSYVCFKESWTSCFNILDILFPFNTFSGVLNDAHVSDLWDATEKKWWIKYINPGFFLVSKFFKVIGTAGGEVRITHCISKKSWDVRQWTLALIFSCCPHQEEELSTSLEWKLLFVLFFWLSSAFLSVNIGKIFQQREIMISEDTNSPIASIMFLLQKVLYVFDSGFSSVQETFDPTQC